MRLPFIRIEHQAATAPVPVRPPLVDLILDDEPHGPARSVSDLIAPAAITIAADHLLLDGQFARVLALVGLPPSADAGWLEPLIASALPGDVSLFLQPVDVGATASQLARRHTRLQSSLSHDVREGRPTDPDLLAADEQVARLRHALARGVERPFTVGLYVLLRARSRAELARLTRQSQDVLAALGGRLVIARLQQESGLHACLPEGSDALAMTHPVETSSLVTAYPFPPAQLDPPHGVPLGFDRRTRAPIALDVFDDRVCRNANVVVFGPGGVGKSYAVKLWLLRTLLLDQHTDVLVIDPKHEYVPLVEALGESARFVRLAAASGHRVNPFDLPPPGPRQPPREVLGDHIQQLLGLLELLLAEPGGSLGGRARARLDGAVLECYRLTGITVEPDTHDSQPPTLGALQAILDLDAEMGNEIAESLAERLRPFTQGSQAGGLLHGETTVSLDRRLTVFGLLDLAEASWPIAMQLLAGWVWTQVRREPGHQRLLVVDEVWRLLRHPAGAAFLESLARLARAAGLGLVAISQDVRVVLDDEHGRTIAENAATALLLGQSPETLRPLTEAYDLAADEQADLLAIGAGRDPGGSGTDRTSDRRGEGLLFVSGRRLWLKSLATPREHELATTAFREVAGLRTGGPT
jgi:hypothetical protein